MSGASALLVLQTNRSRESQGLPEATPQPVGPPLSSQALSSPGPGCSLVSQVLCVVAWTGLDYHHLGPVITSLPPTSAQSRDRGLQMDGGRLG